MADNVVPFARPLAKPAKAQLPPAERALHPRVRRAALGARALAAEQAAAAREDYGRASATQKAERLLREGTPVPARITMALDMRGLDGADVDTQCGAAEPDVDLWE